MTNKEYKDYLQLTIKITGGDDRASDLLHDVMIQLSDNTKYKELSPNDKKYFLVKSIQNQYYSNSSSFKRKYKKYSFVELEETFEKVDTIYEEEPTMEWVKETLEEELKKNPDFWYNKGIFDLWIKHNGFIERIHKQTSIPRYSLKDTIKEVKKLIKTKWREYKDGEDKA